MADQNTTGAQATQPEQQQQQEAQTEDGQKQEQQEQKQQQRGEEDNPEAVDDTDGQQRAGGQEDDGEQELQEQRHAFRFHFGPNEDGGEGEGDDEELPPLAPAEEILYRPQGVQATDMEEWSLNDDIKLLKGLVGGEQAAELLNDPRVSGNDLIPNVYEGGFKLWEGAGDLCRYLVKKLSLTGEHLLRGPQDHKTPLSGKRVLELGCGHGLPGILAMLAGAEVHFQDFNREVLMSLTVPNVLANASRMPPGRAKLPVRFYAGDWLTVGDMLTAQGYGGHYDVILTAESVYSRESQERLLECIKQVLQPPHGVVYVSAKSYYHGVGGGTRSFAELVRAEHLFECKTVLRIDDKAAGNVREVLELKFPEAIMPYFL